MDFFANLLVLIGRVLISLLFLWSAYEKMRHWHQCSEKLKAKGVPQIHIVMPVGFILEIVGGLSVLLGFMPRFGAILLLIFAIWTTYWTHRFWEIKEHEPRKIERLFFMKSLAIIGGLFLILAVGAGRFGFN
jgi:putative oxidoreductase